MCVWPSAEDLFETTAAAVKLSSRKSFNVDFTFSFQVNDVLTLNCYLMALRFIVWLKWL